MRCTSSFAKFQGINFASVTVAGKTKEKKKGRKDSPVHHEAPTEDVAQVSLSYFDMPDLLGPHFRGFFYMN